MSYNFLCKNCNTNITNYGCNCNKLNKIISTSIHHLYESNYLFTNIIINDKNYSLNINDNLISCDFILVNENNVFSNINYIIKSNYIQDIVMNLLKLKNIE